MQQFRERVAQLFVVAHTMRWQVNLLSVPCYICTCKQPATSALACSLLHMSLREPPHCLGWIGQ